MKKLSLLLLLMHGTSYANEDASAEPTVRPSFPTGFIYGAGVAYQQQIYKGFDQRTIAIPLLGYVGEKFNVFGPFVNYSVMRNEDWNFDLNLSPRFNGYEEDDSDFFQGMQERKDSLDAGFTVKYNPNSWSYQFKALADVLSESSGSELELNIAKKFKSNLLTIEPSVSFNRLDNNMVDYYYGVTADEATDLRSFYEGSTTTNRSLNL
ncbi:MAG: MipA/OmpV family protein, partial [Marinicellaceae bacterium]